MLPFHFLRKQSQRKGSRGESLPEQNEGLPDSYTLNGLCPRCGTHSSFQMLGDLPATFDENFAAERDGSFTRLTLDRVSVLECLHCHQCTVVVEEKWLDDTPARVKAARGQISYRGIHWWPLPDIRLSPDIPLEIAGAFVEASTALSAKCPRASAVMARRTLEAIALDKGEAKGRLVEQLKALADKGVLTPALADWAKEVRLVGNAGAHFDPIDDVSLDDARQLTDFIRELLKYLYELPAELQRRRKPKSQPPPT